MRSLAGGILVLLLLVLFLAAVGSGCKPASFYDLPEPGPATPSATNENVDDLSTRLKGVREANFLYIFVFRRKDKDVFTSEDKKYLKDNAPDMVNMWVLTSDKKAVIAGSNFRFFPEEIENLKKRFDMEDLSPKPEPQQTIKKEASNGGTKAP